ncbi:PadR family transcriptional regulator [Patulibacter minatonensis]|uniref:PadR family transcriptional regulator n=1 Tax=Patulibacter minatonensis TaxID=298163 RepID=UPI001B7FACC0|nr:PadR family transcriptional regulator [Patulibacter minatonensis]
MTPGTPPPDASTPPPEPLSPAQVIVLGLLRFAGRATPYDLKQGVAGSVGNFWSVPHSQLYAEPDRLVARGLADVEQEPGGRRRKSYAVTPAGVAALDAWVADPPVDLGELRTPALLAVFFGADPAVVARTQLPQHRAKLEEYERLIEAGAAAGEGVARGPGLTLRAGVLSERAWIAYWTEMLEEAAG